MRIVQRSVIFVRGDRFLAGCPVHQVLLPEGLGCLHCCFRPWADVVPEVALRVQHVSAAPQRTPIGRGEISGLLLDKGDGTSLVLGEYPIRLTLVSSEVALEAQLGYGPRLAICALKGRLIHITNGTRLLSVLYIEVR
jgi:hypothetical protein